MNNENNITSSSMQNNVDLFILLSDIVRHWWMILLAALTGAMLMVLVSTAMYEPVYTTTSTFVVTAKKQTSKYSNQGSAYDAAKSFPKVLESSVMQSIIRENLGYDDYTAKISASVPEDSNLLTLTVTADTAKEAIDVSTIIIDHYDEVAVYSVGSSVLQIIQEPGIPYAPDNALNTKDLAKKGLFGGAAVMVLILAAFSIFHDTVKNEKDAEKKIDARTLGAIAYEWKQRSVKEVFKKKKKAALVDDPMSGFRFVESTKKFVTNIKHRMDKNNAKVLVVSSVAENEGKSTVAANMAITLAKQGKRVVLMDGDIRKPSQQLIFDMDLTDTTEFSEFLQGKGTIADVIANTGRENLLFLGGKTAVADSTELLGSEVLDKLIPALKNAADYVIIDTPPAGLIADAQIFARKADGVLLVTRQNMILAEDINEVIDDFRENECHVLGVVLNGVLSVESIAESPAAGYGRYGYGNYGRYGKYAKYGKYAAYTQAGNTGTNAEKSKNGNADGNTDGRK